jgi:hypothetical protein
MLNIRKLKTTSKITGVLSLNDDQQRHENFQLIQYPDMQRLFFILIIITTASCASKVSTPGTSNNAGGKYSEDLSQWRPRDVVTDTVKLKPGNTQTNPQQTKYVEAKLASNDAVDLVLDSISRINLANGHVDGFTIQIYSGIKREEALNAKKELSGALPDLDGAVEYVQPNFRVRCGKYYDRLQAQKDYLAIKRYFPNAIVIPDRIPIN